jgi:hypothetical protein
MNQKWGEEWIFTDASSETERVSSVTDGRRHVLALHN